VLECLSEDANQVVLELDQVVHDVREESIEDLESSIYLEIVGRINKGEKESH
jgi:hypothetical protein